MINRVLPHRARGLLLRTGWAALLMVSLAGCLSPNLPPPSDRDPDGDAYATLFPLYAEICALSQFQKNAGFGVELSSGIGGHALLYLNGVCREAGVDYPVVVLCDGQSNARPGDGVGLSVNAHYKNANWVAVDGRDFVFTGDLPPGAPLTKEAYEQVLARAFDKGFFRGVVFHDRSYADLPPGADRVQFQYEISVSTDYAVQFGRHRFCGRVPLNRHQMQNLVDYLNSLNAPYRAGTAVFDWDLFRRNCAHINHNAVAAAGIWEPWAMDRNLLIAIFDFPVPKNEFVNLIRRTNDLPIDDLEAMYDDETARDLLLSENRLPTSPGSLADYGALVSENAVYSTQSNIIFYDDPVTGRYETAFNQIKAEPRYFKLRDNLIYFQKLYKKIVDEQRPLNQYLAERRFKDPTDEMLFEKFYDRYYEYIREQRVVVAAQLSAISGAGLRSGS